MKKFWKSLMFAALGVFALSSCEDVPAPYDVPGQGDGSSSTSALFTVDLTQGQGLWTTQDKGELTGVWYHNAQYGMVASGYKSGSNHASESWLISPQIDLTNAKNATMSLNEAVNKIGDGSVAENMTVWVSTDNGENPLPPKVVLLVPHGRSKRTSSTLALTTEKPLNSASNTLAPLKVQVVGKLRA